MLRQLIRTTQTLQLLLDAASAGYEIAIFGDQRCVVF